LNEKEGLFLAPLPLCPCYEIYPLDF